MWGESGAGMLRCSTIFKACGLLSQASLLCLCAWSAELQRQTLKINKPIYIERDRCGVHEISALTQLQATRLKDLFRFPVTIVGFVREYQGF